MKRVAMVVTATMLATMSLLVGTVASQDLPDGDAPITVPAPPVTEAPVDPEAAPADPEPADPGADPVPTTVVEDPAGTTTTTVVEIPDLEPIENFDLPGYSASSGSVRWNVEFADTPAANCNQTHDVAGSSVNVAYDEGGNIGGVYGMFGPGGAEGGGGIFMVGMGAIPVGVGVISVSDGTCEFDAIGIGSYVTNRTVARLDGVGAGVHPGNYTNGEYVSGFTLEASIATTDGDANMDVDAVRGFLLRDRPGLVINQP